ncbi:MAG: tetratricopeptide repeat protein, partial [Phormidesmis sp. FL-bin-119]|nr:tetratricopeptide repeat protein [Pedobacter sp.]
MFTKKARFWVIGVAVFLLGWTISQQVYEITAIIGIGIALLIWGYFREGTVVMAAREFHAKNYDGAEELLKEIEDPEKLGRHRRGFYEFIYGNVELHRQNYEQAEKHFQIATNFPLRNQNDKAIVLVHLANLNLRKKEFERASACVERAKSYKITSRVKKIIEKIEA